MNAILAATPALARRRARTSAGTAADRRRLGLVLGFLAGLVALGPIAAVGAAALGALAARLTESR